MKWVFRQIEGVNRKTLELDGYAAPFGRPRKDPVIKETIKSRVQTTRYPGSQFPTRHAFGIGWEDSEIKGRWATKHLPPGVKASDMADQWTEFIRDESLVEMSWGNLVSYVVFLQELELGRESGDDIAWRMKLLIDERVGVGNLPTAVAEQSLVDKTEQALLALTRVAALEIPDDLGDGLGFFDSLTLLIGKINAGPAFLNHLVNDISDVQKSTFGALAALRAGVTGLQTTVLTARELATTQTIETLAFERSAQKDLQWANWKATFDVETDVLLDILASLDRKAEVGARGNGSKVVTAISGDTWETLATRAKGGPDSAGALRSANGAQYGSRPVPGTTYLVP